MAFADQRALIGLSLAETWRRSRKRARLVFRLPLALQRSTPERLLLAPQDLRTADPTMAEELYAGQFTMGGRSINVGANSPFALYDADPNWLRSLHSFGWFRHLSVSDSALANNHARILVKDWLRLFRSPNNVIAWNTETAAKRLIAWFCHSVLIVEDANMSFYRTFLKSIARHIRFLKRHAAVADDGLPRMTAYIALAFASICVSDQQKSLRKASHDLDLELNRQVLNDGGHISRNPPALVEILALLLPLREAYLTIGQTPSAELIACIDRMMAALRFFRHSDGTLAHFNTTSISEPDLVATLLRYDQTYSKPANSFTSSGFERIERDGAILIMDTGVPFHGPLSATSCAGTLSFEFSASNFRLITNCGVPAYATPDDQAALRSTAAHSTLVLNDLSSSRFRLRGIMSRYLHGQIISGPRLVEVEREDTTQRTVIAASHDGYRNQFGLLHKRTLSVNAAGDKLHGSDEVLPVNPDRTRKSKGDDVAVRFHLHPDIEVGPVTPLKGEICSIRLTTPDNSVWRFTSIDAPMSVQESIYFASGRTALPTRQIVIEATTSEPAKFRWALERYTPEQQVS